MLKDMVFINPRLLKKYSAAAAAKKKSII